MKTSFLSLAKKCQHQIRAIEREQILNIREGRLLILKLQKTNLQVYNIDPREVYVKVGPLWLEDKHATNPLVVRHKRLSQRTNILENLKMQTILLETDCEAVVGVIEKEEKEAI